MVKGQAEYGYTITHIYSFIDINKKIQLFYCISGDHKDLLISPHVKKLALLWESDGMKHTPPRYLSRAFSELVRTEDEWKRVHEAGKVEYIAKKTGTMILQRMELLGYDLSLHYDMRFDVDSKEKDEIRNAIVELGFETDGYGWGAYGQPIFDLHFKKKLTLDEQVINDLADSLAKVVSKAGATLKHFNVKPIVPPPAKSKRKAQWKFW
ncbi:MAG: hypothetical protein MUP98_19720 [Candidatus Aminicenantes bacterium]|nr:hypothetical protein [Candidatus Aminicenantes bacterium]